MLLWIHALKPTLKNETAERTAVAMSCTVLYSSQSTTVRHAHTTTTPIVAEATYRIE